MKNCLNSFGHISFLNSLVVGPLPWRVSKLLKSISRWHFYVGKFLKDAASLVGSTLSSKPNPEDAASLVGSEPQVREPTSRTCRSGSIDICDPIVAIEMFKFICSLVVSVDGRGSPDYFRDRQCQMEDRLSEHRPNRQCGHCGGVPTENDYVCGNWYWLRIRHFYMIVHNLFTIICN